MNDKEISSLSLFKASNFIRTQQAADLLGVTPTTLRRWHVTGKFLGYKHPITGFLYYKLSELNDLYLTLNREKELNKKLKGHF